MGRRSTTGRRRRTTIQRLRRGTCSSPRTSTPPRPAARSRRPRPPRSSTTVGCARTGWAAPATGTYSTTSASPYHRRRGPRPSPTATTSPGTPGLPTTPPSRRRQQVPPSARVPERQRAPEGWGTASGAPAVEPLSRFLAQLPLGHFVAQDLRGLELRLLELLVQVFRDREPDVEAHVIGELERAHRVVVSQLHRFVDVFRRGDPALEHPHRLEAEGQTQPAGREPRRVLHHDRLLVESPRERDGPLYGGRRRPRVRHHLDQLHRVHRIEEVYPHHAAGVLDGGGDVGDRER